MLRQISGWGWTPGLQPASNGPVMPMDHFRDRFLAAFGSHADESAELRTEPNRCVLRVSW